MNPDLQAKRSAEFTIGTITSWIDEWILKATLPDRTKLDLSGISSDTLKK